MMSEEGRRRLLERMRVCLGAGVLAALEAPEVSEIMLNPDGQLFAERIGGTMEPIGTMSPTAAEAVLGLVAHAAGSIINQDRPIVTAILPPMGWRIEGLLPPLASGPCFSIRRPTILSVTLTNLVERGTLTKAASSLLERAVSARRNIVVAGSTGSGKTTVADALLQAVATADPQHRVVVLEDTPELGQRVANQVSLRTGDNVDMARLLRSTLRLRPDRIIVGELRDGSALTLLKAWNTGHAGGITTIHAGSASAALLRLEQLAAEATAAPMGAMIAEAVDLIVVIVRTSAGRRVTEIVSVDGLRDGHYQLTPLLTEDHRNAA